MRHYATELTWKWCSREGEKCNCGHGHRVRFGHSGLAKYYKDKPNYFVEHPDTVRWKSLDIGNKKTKPFLKCGNHIAAGPTPW